MLQVDLSVLDREKRLRIDTAVAVEDPRWDETGVRLARPLEVELDVSMAGTDVLVRGRIRGETAGECRRCLKAVRIPLDDAVTLLYRADTSPAEAEPEEVYALPERGGDLDLWPALREVVLVAMPEYPVCRDECPGLCGRCGRELETGPCGCGDPDPDERWAALRELKR